MRSHDPIRLLRWLNEGLLAEVEGGEISLQLGSEVRGPRLRRSWQLMWNIPLHRIVEGPCSFDVKAANPDHPMGQCLAHVFEDGDSLPPRCWLTEVLKPQESDPQGTEIIDGSPPPTGNVLVFAHCGGCYDGDYKDMLRGRFPSITWLFPQVPDFCRQFQQVFLLPYHRSFVEELLRKGILRIE